MVQQCEALASFGQCIWAPSPSDWSKCCHLEQVPWVLSLMFAAPYNDLVSVVMKETLVGGGSQGR